VRAPHQHHQREDLRVPLVLVHHPLIPHPSGYKMFLAESHRLPKGLGISTDFFASSSHSGLFTSFCQEILFYYINKISWPSLPHQEVQSHSRIKVAAIISFLIL
jgi:hypothetical protein